MATKEATVWQQLYDQAEELWTGPMQEVMGSDAFGAMMQAGREAYLLQQETLRDSAEKYWEALRIPTKQDHAALAKLVVNLENRMDTLEDKLDQVLDRLSEARKK